MRRCVRLAGEMRNKSKPPGSLPPRKMLIFGQQNWTSDPKSLLIEQYKNLHASGRSLDGAPTEEIRAFVLDGLGALVCLARHLGDRAHSMPLRTGPSAESARKPAMARGI